MHVDVGGGVEIFKRRPGAYDEGDAAIYSEYFA